MKAYLFPGIMLVLLTGCASLPLLDMGKDQLEDQKHYYYDVDSKIAYSINKDDHNIYISLKSDNETTIRSLFRQGLYIYLDPNGRKSKDIYFNYPLSAKMSGRGSGMMQKEKMQMQYGPEQAMRMPEFNVNDLIDHADMEAIFSYRDLAEKMPVYSQRTDIAVTLSSPKEGTFLYELRIPLDRLGKDDLSQVSIGIETGTIDMPSMGAGPGGGMQGSGPGAGNMGGSPTGGGGHSGIPGGRQGGDFSPLENMEKISIWFKVNIEPGIGN
jgi:hypothetical protein